VFAANEFFYENKLSYENEKVSMTDVAIDQWSKTDERTSIRLHSP